MILSRPAQDWGCNHQNSVLQVHEVHREPSVAHLITDYKPGEVLTLGSCHIHSNIGIHWIEVGGNIIQSEYETGEENRK